MLGRVRGLVKSWKQVARTWKRTRCHGNIIFHSHRCVACRTTSLPSLNGLSSAAKRPFARSGLMVRNLLCWDASYTVRFSKQRKVKPAEQRAQSTHAITNMHASVKEHCNDAYLDRSWSTLMQRRTVKLSPTVLTRKTIERKNIAFSQRIRPDGRPVVSHAWELDWRWY